jgi:hypothetical protein
MMITEENGCQSSKTNGRTITKWNEMN